MANASPHVVARFRRSDHARRCVLRMLHDAGHYVAALPYAAQEQAEWQTAAEMLILAAQGHRPLGREARTCRPRAAHRRLRLSRGHGRGQNRLASCGRTLIAVTDPLPLRICDCARTSPTHRTDAALRKMAAIS